MNPSTIVDGFVDVQGISLYYKYFFNAADKPTMVVIPGGPGFSHDYYVQALLPFTPFANILFYDPRGRGKSQSAPNLDDYKIEHEISELNTLLEILGKNFSFDQVILHGTSYGCVLAQGFACKFREKTAKLILVAGAPSYEFLTLAKIELAKRGDEEQKAICAQYLWPGNFDAAAMDAFSFHTSTLYSYTTKEKITRYHSDACSLPVLNRAFKSNFDEFDFTPSLKNITCPTLILAGRHDWIMPLSLAKKIHEHIKQSRLIIFENSGHALARDEPQLYFEAISSFI